MGWTFLPSWTRKTLIDEILSPSHWGERYKHIAHTGNNLWLVMEFLENGQPVYRFIALFLLQNGGADNGWGYKDMDESCGPVQKNCPLKYLELAPFTEKYHGGSYAAKWREEVKQFWAAKKTSREEAAKMKCGEQFKSFSGKTFLFKRIHSPSFGKLYRVRTFFEKF